MSLTALTVSQILNGLTNDEMNAVIMLLDKSTVKQIAAKTASICFKQDLLTEFWIPGGRFYDNVIYKELYYFIHPPNHKLTDELKRISYQFFNEDEVMSFDGLYPGNHHPALLKLVKMVKGTKYDLGGYIEKRFIPEGKTYCIGRGCHNEILVDIIEGKLEIGVISEDIELFLEKLRVKYGV